MSLGQFDLGSLGQIAPLGLTARQNFPKEVWLHWTHLVYQFEFSWGSLVSGLLVLVLYVDFFLLRLPPVNLQLIIRLLEMYTGLAVEIAVFSCLA